MSLLRVDRRLVAVLFALSLAAKLAGLAYVNAASGGELTTPDTRGVYRPLAEGILSGKGYQLGGDHRDATRVPPLYPFYLAALYGVFGRGAPDWVFGFLNGFWRATTTVVVCLLGARFFGPGAGAWAGLLHACDPWEAFWSAYMLKESLAVFFLVAAVWSAVSALDRPSCSRAALAGSLMGLASLVRYMTLGLFPCVLAVVAREAVKRRLAVRDSVRLVVGCTMGLLVVLAPWLWRNYEVFGRVVLSSHFAGRYFYVANDPWLRSAPETSGHSEQTVDVGNFIRGVELTAASPGEAEWTFFERAIVHIVSHPAAAGTVVAAKLVNMWRPTFTRASRRNLLLLGLPYCGLMALAAWGLASSWGERDRLKMLYLPLAFLFLSHLAFTAEIRDRQYMTPFLSVFAGHTLARSTRRP